MSVLLAHAGKQHSYQIAYALDQIGKLEKFITSSYVRNPSIQNWFTSRNDQFWTRRFIKGLGGNKVESNWRFELKELLYARLFGAGVKTQQAVYDRDVRFDRYLARRMQRYEASSYWGFQGSSLFSLESAINSGKHAICELATGHLPTAEKILGEEKRLLPEWADSIDHAQFPDRYRERLINEPQVADEVIVASEFSKKTVEESGIPSKKISVLPLGFDASSVSYKLKRERHYQNRALRLLYTGRITQRKGIAYLLEAIESFSNEQVQLDIIGFIHGSGKGLAPYTDRVNLIAPMSQEALFRKYADYDALILPTLFEGFGLVIVEAMAAGLPVITTPHSIGPEIITDDINGYVVPIRSTDAIASAIDQLLQKTPDQLIAMRQAAHESAQAYSWQAYISRLSPLVSRW